MIVHSIRWRLQIWYGLMLVAVLAAFGLTAYRLERGLAFGRADDELRGQAIGMANAFRPPPRGRGPDQGPFDRSPNSFPPMREGQGQPGPPMREPPGQPGPREPGPPMREPGQPFNGGEPGGFDQRPPEFRLPQRAAEFFADTDTNNFYFAIFTRDGNELARSSNAPAGVIPPPVVGGPRGINRPPPGAPGSGPPLPRMRGAFREVTVPGRPGEVVLAGRSMAPEFGQLRQIAWALTGVGALVLLFGLTGGWWLVSRAIRPIEDISTAAVKIAAGDLSQRVNAADTDSELGRLASVLNSTFARLEAAFSQQQQFTSDAAHELRTPVSVMLTQAQAALSRARSPAEYREAVETCERAAQRMRRLIESLLELARLDAGQENMRRAPFDLARVVMDGVEHIRPLAAARHLTIHTSCSAAECHGDSERIAQVVTNLLTNAVHYNNERGQITITTARGNDFASLTVADTGPGIAAEHLPHVFERFYRADPARTSSAGRAGLGLAISKAIVEAHGGSLEVSSQPGEGATFTVRLPA